MDLRLARLETLAAVARLGSLSRAARELHLSQPAVSMQVHQLELALGLPLPERAGQRAFPPQVRERELAVSPFYRDEVVAIAPPDRRWRRGRRAAARDLVSAPLILFERGATLRRVIDDWFRRAGEVPAAAMELGNTEAIKKLVEAGLGLSVTSWFGVAAEVRRRKLAAARLDPPPYPEVRVIRPRRKPPAPGLAAFLATLEGLRPALA